MRGSAAGGPAALKPLIRLLDMGTAAYNRPELAAEVEPCARAQEVARAVSCSTMSAHLVLQLGWGARLAQQAEVLSAGDGGGGCVCAAMGQLQWHNVVVCACCCHGQVQKGEQTCLGLQLGWEARFARQAEVLSAGEGA